MNNYKYKLSIIIPMFNAEQYIAKCLDSILDSDLPKGVYEVIVVNDGSEDSGEDIVMKYVSKHNNFKYVTQENQGQGAARNKGIDLSRGEYIWFIDSDDIICTEQNYIYSFLVNNRNIDIIKTKIKTFGVGEPVRYTQLDGSYTHYSGRDLLLNKFHPSSVCNMIISRSILINNNLRFITGIFNEDVEFCHRLYAYAQNIYTFKYITYLYLHNSDSTTQSIDYERVYKRERSNIIISKSFDNFSQKIKKADQDLSIFFYNMSGNVLLGLLLSMIRKKSERRGKDINMNLLIEMKNEGVYPITKKFDSIKKTLFVKLINIESVLKLII